MNEQNYNNLKTSVKVIFENNTEIAKGIKNLVEHLSEDFQSNTQDVLFVRFMRLAPCVAKVDCL